MKKIGKLLRYLRDFKPQVVLYFFTSIFAIVFGIFSIGMLAPVMQVLFRAGGTLPKTPAQARADGLTAQLSDYVDSLVRSYGNVKVLTFVCVTLIVFAILKNLFVYLSVYTLNPLRNAILLRLRNELFDKMLSLPIGYFTEERKGDLISRITNDINEVEQSILATMEVLIRDPLTILITLTTMIIISPALTVFLLIFLPPTGYLIGKIGKSLKRYSGTAQEQLGQMLGIVDETLSGMRVVKAFNAEQHQSRRFTDLNQHLFRTRNRIAARRDLGSPVSEAMGIFAVSVILWYGGNLIFSNSTSLKPEQFLLYIALFTQIINPFKNLSSCFFNIQKGTAALERIEQVLDAEVTVKDAPDALPVAGFEDSIELRNVKFSYGPVQILEGIDLKIKKGSTVALVGASGSGKSTLVDLIPRFHDVSGGQILLDGVDVRNYKVFDLRKLIGVVSQDPILFNDSIAANISLGSEGKTEDSVREAAEVAHAHLFIQNKSGGYDTNVGDRGSKLSGGERQRLTIARAVLKNPPILILDEATSSLDTESERIVQEAINTLMQNRTCIVIAHRLSTVQHADEIIVMDKGRIVQRGTHDSLMQQEGVYRRLVQMQAMK